MKMYPGGFLCLMALPVFFSCSSAPKPPVESPGVEIVFDRIEAGSPREMRLCFFLNIENHFPRQVRVYPESASISLNGADFPGDSFAVNIPPGIFLEANSEISVAFSVDIKLEKYLKENKENFDEYMAVLSQALNFTYQDGTSSRTTASISAAFPRIREPEFRITSIAVRQAELINTRLMVRLQINNPNPFPLELSAFSYKLYGAGRFWADGQMEDVLRVPSRASIDTRLYLIMNFINMKRELLDQVIEMSYVPYRFSGEANICSEIAYLPNFPITFDRSGDSPVVK